MKFKSIRCKSGLMGEEFKLRDAYKNFKEYKSFCDIWGLHKRLGYERPRSAWKNNPTVQCSTKASDYRKVTQIKKMKKDLTIL